MDAMLKNGETDGNVMPCSSVRKLMGDLLELPFADIWRSRGEQVPCPYARDAERSSKEPSQNA